MGRPDQSTYHSTHPRRGLTRLEWRGSVDHASGLCLTHEPQWDCVCKVRCCAENHRIFWDGARYVSPDHQDHHRALQAVTKEPARCLLACNLANRILVGRQPFGPRGDTPKVPRLTKHARQSSLSAARRVLDAAELPFDAGMVVALRWLTGPAGMAGPMDSRLASFVDPNGLHAAREMSKIRTVADVISTATARAKRTKLDSHLARNRHFRIERYEFGKRVLIALHDGPWNRLIVWLSESNQASVSKSPPYHDESLPWRPTGSQWPTKAARWQHTADIGFAGEKSATSTAWAYEVYLANTLSMIQFSWNMAQYLLAKNWLQCDWPQAWAITWESLEDFPIERIRMLGSVKDEYEDEEQEGVEL